MRTPAAITIVKVRHTEYGRGAFHWRDGRMPSGPVGRVALFRILTAKGVEGLAPCNAVGNVVEIKWRLLARTRRIAGASGRTLG